MKDDKKITGGKPAGKLQVYLAGLTPEMAEQLRVLYRLAIPELEPDDEELAVQALAKELVALKIKKKIF